MKSRDFKLMAFLLADLRRQQALACGASPPPSPWRLALGCLSPRFAPVLLSRVAHWLHRLHLGPLAKLVSLCNFVVFGIEISVRCPIGRGLVLTHTQGTVIGAASIGENAIIFQGVTLGAKELDMGFTESLRPVVGNDVVIGSGAKVLGGITIGNGAIIGANAVVLKSLPDGVVAVGIPARFRSAP